MVDYLPAKMPDYNYTLNITPMRTMPIKGQKKQVVHEYDDESVTVIPFSSQSKFDIQLQWDWLEDADAEELLDLWHNINRANGKERTFYWQHPLESNVYVVRFMEPLTIVATSNHVNAKEIKQITLRIEGKL